MTATNTAKLPVRREADVVSREITAIYATVRETLGKIQELAIQCLLNHDVANNPALCNKLVAEMPRGLKKQSLAEWFVMFGTLKINPNVALRKAVPLVYDKTKAMDYEGACNTAWFDVAPTPDVVQELDIGKRIAALMQACEGKEIKVNGKVLKAEDARALLGHIAELTGSTFVGKLAGEKEAVTKDEIDALPVEPPAPAPAKRVKAAAK